MPSAKLNTPGAPTPSPGGNKGGNKGCKKGKGKGKGPKGVCYSCGGPHFQRQCPLGNAAGPTKDVWNSLLPALYPGPGKQTWSNLFPEGKGKGSKAKGKGIDAIEGMGWDQVS